MDIIFKIIRVRAWWVAFNI